MDTREKIDNAAALTASSAEKQGMSDGLRIGLLVIGDVLVFLIFATVGRKSHGESLQPIGIVQTALPFMISWFLISPFVGLFRRELARQPGKMALRTLLAWVPAWILGMLIRSLSLFEGRIPQPAFWVVALIVVTVLLLAWHVPFALVYRRKYR